MRKELPPHLAALSHTPSNLAVTPYEADKRRFHFYKLITDRLELALLQLEKHARQKHADYYEDCAARAKIRMQQQQ